MKNKLTDLNNHLFEMLERLNDEELTGEQLSVEVVRAETIAKISTQIISNAGLIFKAQKLQLEYDRTPFKPQPLLGQGVNNE